MEEDLDLKLEKKIKGLLESVWKEKITSQIKQEWLKNFSNNEQLNAKYILSHFLYFGIEEIRVLLKALYRDKFKYPIIHEIREKNNNTTDYNFIQKQFTEECLKSRFLPIGNPAESGSHMLYFFRQENRLPKDYFINSYEIFSDKDIAADYNIKRYIFIDDFCCTGSQVVRYSKDIINQIEDKIPICETYYLPIFATKKGLSCVKAETKFTKVDTVVCFDDSFKCFESISRFYKNNELDTINKISNKIIEEICLKYKMKTSPDGKENEENYNPSGYEDSQLAIGFYHNTPNNSLPIFWYEEANKWKSIFKRYPKIYGLKE